MLVLFSVTQTPGASPYALATPPSIKPVQHISIANCLSVEDTQRWLLLNRFGQYSSLFANFTGNDFLCMNRQDLMDLCGQADGIRLYNAINSRTLKTLYVRFKEEDKGQLFPWLLYAFIVLLCHTAASIVATLPPAPLLPY
jgi:transcription factor CP2-like protein